MNINVPKVSTIQKFHWTFHVNSVIIIIHLRRLYIEGWPTLALTPSIIPLRRLYIEDWPTLALTPSIIPLRRRPYAKSGDSALLQHHPPVAIGLDVGSSETVLLAHQRSRHHHALVAPDISGCGSVGAS